MKVILTEEVVGLGEPGKLVDVAPGYARNFLVPRKLAVYANTANVREMEHHKARLERKRQRLVAAARGTAERISEQTITIEAKAGPGGRLFGSVTTTAIAAAMEAQLGTAVDRRRLHLSEPIHTVGDYTVDVHLLGETHATVKVHVFDPSAPVAAPAPAPVAVEVPAEESAE
jgi:large subunit ribosomal protein L9